MVGVAFVRVGAVVGGGGEAVDGFEDFLAVQRTSEEDTVSILGRYAALLVKRPLFPQEQRDKKNRCCRGTLRLVAV